VADVKNTQTKKNQSKAKKQATVASIMAKKKAVTKTIDIQLDGEVADRIADLRSAHTAARDSDRLSNTPDKAGEIMKQIEELVEASQDTVVTFSFKSIGRFRYDELAGEHPPDEDAKKEGAEFNADTFPPALVHESCFEITPHGEDPIPGMSLEEAVDMFESPDWNGAELRRLFFGALEVNTETGDIPLSRDGSEGTVNSLLNLITQQNAASPTLSM